MPISDKNRKILIAAGIIMSFTCIALIVLLILLVILYYKYNNVDSDSTVNNYLMIEGVEDPSIPDSQKVVVYGSDAYGQKLASFLAGKYIFTQNADNKVMSLKIPAGYEVHLYDDNNFKKELAVYKIDAVLPVELRNKTSAIVINKI